MNELPSAEFRKQYARLTEPTTVTVNGHPIGTWHPWNYVKPLDMGKAKPGDFQKQRDELLRKINRR